MHSHFPARLLPVVYIVFAGLMSMTLAGCGVKPSTLSPPPGSAETNYPHTYPDTETDSE